MKIESPFQFSYRVNGRPAVRQLDVPSVKIPSVQQMREMSAHCDAFFRKRGMLTGQAFSATCLHSRP